MFPLRQLVELAKAELAKKIKKPDTIHKIPNVKSIDYFIFFIRETSLFKVRDTIKREKCQVTLMFFLFQFF